jgi:ferredoxin
MSYARQMLDTYPGTFDVDDAVLAAAIDALSDCAQACTADVDADLSEQNLAEMVTCIRLCLDCADVCTATAAVLSRRAQRHGLVMATPGRLSRPVEDTSLTAGEDSPDEPPQLGIEV